MNIIFDLDGVLADFDLGFTVVANKLFGTPINNTFEQKEFSFRDLLSAKQQAEVWRVLMDAPDWWRGLTALVSGSVFLAIDHLTHSNEVYFVTNRMHHKVPAGEQTVAWLQDHGLSSPRVIVSAAKGEVARAVKADFALEDNWGNACAIHWMAGQPQCRVFLIERRYNEIARRVIPEGITRVKRVEEFIDAVRFGEPGVERRVFGG